MAGRLDSNPVFALWYLLATALDGSRGAPGPILAALIAACVWSLAALLGVPGRQGGALAHRHPAPAAPPAAHPGADRPAPAVAG